MAESVWDYPRPPALQRVDVPIQVRHGDTVVARAGHAWKVMETASPPTYYLPPESLQVPTRRASGASHCEWKGRATYHDVLVGDEVISRAAWSYADPNPAFAPLKDHLAFYASKLDCLLDGETVQPQTGDFYGGWITRQIQGPFKGDPGTLHW